MDDVGRWRIRQDRPEDQADLCELVLALQSYEAQLHKSDKANIKSAKQHLKSLQQAIRDFGGELWLAVNAKDKPIAFLVGLIQYQDPATGNSSNSPKGLISDLYVSPDWQNQGIAHALISEAERFFEIQSCQSVSVANLASNKKAAQFYAKLGYGIAFEWREKQL